MFIAALFTITKIWKQLKHPLIFGCIKTHTHTVGYYLAMEKTNVLM